MRSEPDDDIRPADRPARRTGQRATEGGPVWTRGAAPKPERVTLEAVLNTAIRLADTEGLDAVSVRRVAAELKARPMSLYSFFSRKDDLIDLMIDRIMGEMLLDKVPPSWREALLAIARRTHEVAMAHPWLMVAFSQRPPLGPNAVHHMEQSLAAIAVLDLDPVQARTMLMAADTYTVGAAMLALSELQMRQRDQLTVEQWHDSTEAYFERLAASEDYPHFTGQGNADLLRRSTAVDTFEEGFGWLLNGFAQSVGIKDS